MPSSWIYFPTEENPKGKYKYVSIEINMSPDFLTIERQTYSLLDYLGDLGGLNDALFAIVKTLISPISAFALHSTILTNYFRFRKSKNAAGNDYQKPNDGTICEKQT